MVRLVFRFLVLGGKSIFRIKKTSVLNELIKNIPNRLSYVNRLLRPTILGAPRRTKRFKSMASHRHPFPDKISRL
jgi:hypothetical protein